MTDPWTIVSVIGIAVGFGVALIGAVYLKLLERALSSSRTMRSMQGYRKPLRGEGVNLTNEIRGK
jgi:hypothetical protein